MYNNTRKCVSLTLGELLIVTPTSVQVAPQWIGNRLAQ